ncbi:TIGR00341 family protein [uncultured Croceicoccus sp.]|uniref:TIGR00341 family protein n=1 Tax=uncultured Croceicoccus sp. TaxID=1295329 RepID=UPI002633A6C8|nr:TIGR00341 family protein [uncultured Croceicoccus sp.]
MVDQSDAIEKSRESFKGVLLSWRLWWRHSVVASVDQGAVIEERREEAIMSARYLFMLAMSAGIAVLGLLLSSPAVVIGAMLLSPLMGPIIGLGFALSTGDYNWLRKALRALIIGSVLSIAFCGLIVVLSPLQTVTPEIASRTRPNLFDLLVALFSAMAGAYAMIRGRAGTIVGVAIATALMPPLAVVGFGLATWNWTVFSGALLLYVTNLVTIALTAMIMARLYGFRANLSENKTRLQDFIVVAAFIALVIPLALSLRQIAWEANSQRLVNGAILDAFPDAARVSQIDIDFKSDPIRITATVLTPEIENGAEERSIRRLNRLLEAPVTLQLDQFRVGTSATAAEEAQIAAANAQERAASDRTVQDLTERMALIAGVSGDDVLIDRDRRRATVRARPLDGATLSAYRQLERRIAQSVPEWRIELIPPARALPEVAFEDGAPTDAGRDAIALIGWAGQRIDAPIALSGGEDNIAAVRERLSPAVRVVERTGGGANVTATWAPVDTVIAEETETPPAA